MFLKKINNIYDCAGKISVRIRAIIYYMLRGIRIKKIGMNFKIIGASEIEIGRNFCVGDSCWIEAVKSYGGKKYFPVMKIRDDVSFSSNVHVSAAKEIVIEQGCLLGSNIYIGDHTHGPTKINIEIINVLPIPAKRELDNLGPIIIGARSWICDGVVILPNSRIHHDSIIAANSVVKLVTNRPALIAGAPAKIIRYLDEK